MRVKEELILLGAKICSLDNSVFMWYNKGVLEGVMCIYVDDFLSAGTSAFNKDVIRKLMEKFLIGSTGSVLFKYVGLNIDYRPEGITVVQMQYESSQRSACK